MKLGLTTPKCLALAVSLIGALSLTQSVLAAPGKAVRLEASGHIASQTFCSATELCQESFISGVATHLGRFDATLLERLNLLDGTFTGSSTITTQNGDTISTVSAGVFTPPDENSITSYVEHHEVISGTGRFAEVTGEFDVLGTANASTFKIAAEGVGELVF